MVNEEFEKKVSMNGFSLISGRISRYMFENV